MNTQKTLISITNQDGKQVVSARELHTFLASKQEFSNWVKNRINQYDLIENVDFIRLTNLSSEHQNRGGQNKVEYILSIDAAKELSMVEGNEKGKQARRYFIEMEKRAKLLQSSTPSDREMKLVEALEQTNNLLQRLMPPIWFPEGTNSVSPIFFDKVVEAANRQNHFVEVDHEDVANFMENAAYVKKNDNLYFPTQLSLSFGVMQIEQATLLDATGRKFSFGRPVFTELGVTYLTEKICEYKQRENFIKYPPIVN